MKVVLEQTAGVLRDDGFLCLVIGDVRRRSDGEEILLGERVAQQCCPSRLKLIDVIADDLPVEHKVSRIWAKNEVAPRAQIVS